MRSRQGFQKADNLFHRGATLIKCSHINKNVHRSEPYRLNYLHRIKLLFHKNLFVEYYLIKNIFYQQINLGD